MKLKFLILISFAFLLAGSGLIILEPGFFSSPHHRVYSGKITPQHDSQSPTQVLGLSYEDAFVTRVIDGDTIEVSLNGQAKKVRFLGMDTPETVDPRKPVGCFGKEASNETKSLLENKEILMQKDVSETDMYGRLLRFVYLKLDNGQTLFVNDFLVREGYARVLTIPPDTEYQREFQEAQRQATLQKAGLWSKCS